MNSKYLSVPFAELKKVILKEEALVSFYTKDLNTPTCIHIQTTSMQFKQITFIYIYNEVKQSWFDVLLKRKRYILAKVHNTHFGTQIYASPLQTSEELSSNISSWREEYKPLNHIYKAH